MESYEVKVKEPPGEPVDIIWENLDTRSCAQSKLFCGWIIILFFAFLLLFLVELIVDNIIGLPTKGGCIDIKNDYYSNFDEQATLKKAQSDYEIDSEEYFCWCMARGTNEIFSNGKVGKFCR